MKTIYKILTTKIEFNLKMASGEWYQFLLPRNILTKYHDFKLIRWLWFIWRWDK